MVDILEKEKQEKKNKNDESEDFAEVIQDYFSRRTVFLFLLMPFCHVFKGHMKIGNQYRKKLKENRNISFELEATKDLNAYVANIETRKEIQDMLSQFNCKLFCIFKQ